MRHLISNLFHSINRQDDWAYPTIGSISGLTVMSLLEAVSTLVMAALVALTGAFFGYIFKLKIAPWLDKKFNKPK